MGYTKEQWELAGESSNEGESYVIIAGNRTIAHLTDTFDDGTGEASTTPEDLANAKLIAAAPELLSACNKAEEALHNVPMVGEVYDQQHSDTQMRAILELQDAINKATT